MALSGAERQRRYRERLGQDVVREQRRAHYLANKDREAALSKAWAAANPDKVREKAARYRERHPDRVAQAQAKYSATPAARERYRRYYRGSGKEYRKRWEQQNYERVLMSSRLSASRRRARINGNGVYDVSAKDLRRLLNSSCAACSAPGQHIDHIIPISRGGRHSIGNLQTLCQPCNSSKGSKYQIEWRWSLMNQPVRRR